MHSCMHDNASHQSTTSQHLRVHNTLACDAVAILARVPPATEEVITTRLTVDLCAAALVSTLRVPHTAGSIRSFCGFGTSMMNGDLCSLIRLIMQPWWSHTVNSLAYFPKLQACIRCDGTAQALECWRSLMKAGLRCVKDILAALHCLVECTLLQQVGLKNTELPWQGV